MTELIKGAGGGGSKPRTPVETPNTLLSKTTAKVLFLLSQGETGGLADQINPAKAVYFNNVPVMNSDGSPNFPNVQIDERYGLPSQDVLPGFTQVANAFNVNTKVLVSTPVTYQTATSDIDAVRVTVRFPALFQTEDNGDINKTTVQFGIYRRLGAGAWELVRNVWVNDKTNAPSDIDYTVERPAGTGTWGVQLRRVTADNTSSSKANDIFFQTATQLKYAQLPYNNRAVVGVTVTADQTGAQYPTVAFDYVGIKVKVPSNYNVTTRAYTGAWNGTFAAQRQVTDNPAWILYDLLTNTWYGMGIAEADIDKFSFYDAAVYNDGLVPALVGGAYSGTEPRYTFNHQYLDGQEDAWSMLQNLAASFGAVVYTANNLVKLVQDRPTNWSRVLTNSNVIDGKFEYSSSALNTRTTACVVYWQNPDENWLATPSYYEDAAAVARYGYNLKEIEGVGLTTEGQAMRLAKWTVETSISNLATALFKVGFENAGLTPGEVVKIADSEYAQVMNEAVVISSGSGTFTLDRAVNVTNGDTLDVQASDGSVQTRTISISSTGSTITYSGDAVTVTPGAKIIFTGAISPRFFKVLSVREEKPGEWTVSAAQYDPNKFGRVDNTPTGPTPVFQLPVLVTSAPQNLTFREGAVNDNGNIRRSLLVSWSRPAQGVVSGYRLQIRRDTGAWDVRDVSSTSFEITPAADGLYEVEVQAVGTSGVLSSKATGSYTLAIGGGSASPLNAPTSLQIIGGGTNFSGLDVNFQFTNPSSNASVAAVLRDFEIRVIETVGSTELRRFTVPATPAGQIQTGAYTYSMNLADGGPRRTVQIQVRCRDTNNNLSNPVTATFTNPAPAVVSGISVVGGIGNVKITFDKPTDADFAGVLVWRSTTNGFTPSSGNLVYDTTSNYISDSVDFGTTYYYKLAAYDQFSRPVDGAGLNISTQQSGAAQAGEGIPEVSTLPNPSGYTGPKIVFLESDGQLYSYIDGAWEPTIPPVSDVLDGSITVAKFAAGLEPVKVVTSLPSTKQTEVVFLTTENKLYRWNGTAYVASIPATDISGQLTNDKIAALDAAKLTGSLDMARIAQGAIDASKFNTTSVSVPSLQTSNPTTGNFVGRLIYRTDLNKLFRWDGSQWTATVPASDVGNGITNEQIASFDAAKLTGVLNPARLEPGAIDASKFASSIKPVEIITGALPAAPHIAGRVVFRTDDGKLYRNTGSGWVASIAAVDISGQLTNDKIAALDAAKLTGSLDMARIQDGAINAAKFASSIKPVEIITGALPAAPHTAGRVVFRTDDGKLYRNTGSGWTAAVALDDIPTIPNAKIEAVDAAKLTGTLDVARIANNALDATKFATSLTVPLLTTSNPSTGNFVGRLIYRTDLNKLLRWNGSAWVSDVDLADIPAIPNSKISDLDAAKLTGTLNVARIAAGALDATKFATSLSVPTLTTTNPTTGNFVGRLIYRTDLNKLFRWDGSTWTAAVDGADIVANSITGGKIQAGAIGANELAANAITTEKLLIKSFANLVENANFEAGQVGWTASTRIVNTAGEPYQGSWVYRMVQASSANAVISEGNIVPCQPGDAFMLRGWGRSDEAATGNFSLRIRWYSATNALLSQSSVQWDNPSPTWSLRSNAFVAPANTAYLRVSLYTTGVGTFWWDEITLTRAANAELIVDGSITTAKITAAGIDGDVIQAGTLNANRIEAGTLSAGQIATGTLSADRIGAGTITSSKLYTGAVQADRIQSGNIAAGAIGAEQIAANSITASKLFVGDTSNVFPDFDMQDTGFYSTSTAAPYLFTGTSYTGTGQRRLIITPSVDTELVATQWFQVEPSTDYRVELHLSRENGTTGTAVAYWETATLSAAGAVTASTSGTIGSSSAVSSTQRFGASVLTGSGVRRMRLVFERTGGGDGQVTFGGVVVRRRATGSLIVDGSITTEKITAGGISGGVIQAGTLHADRIQTGTLSATQIATGTLSADRIGAGTITSSKLYTGAVQADRIQAGNIAAGAIGATEIAANSITASKLVLADFTNGFPNPTFSVNGAASNDGWTGGASTALARSAGGVPTNAPTAFVLRVAVGAGAVDVFGTGTIEVTPGDSYYVEVLCASDATANRECRIMVEYRDVTGASVNWATVATRAAPNQTWVKISGIHSVPATIGGFVPARARVFLSTRGSSGGTGNWYFAKPVFRKAASAELIVDGTITTNMINAAGISGTAITAGTLHADRIQTGTLSANQIATGTLSADRIGANSITSAKLYTGAVQADRIQAGNIAAGAIGATEIAANAVTAEKILGGSIIAGKLAANSIDSNSLFVNGVITGQKLYSGAVEADRIQANNLAANSITAGKIAAGAINASSLFVNGVVGAGALATASVVAGKIDAGAINASNLFVDGVITGNKIAANTITAANIQAGQISTALLAAGAVTASKIVVTDTSNIVADPMMIDNSAWTNSSGTGSWTAWGTSITDDPSFRSTRFMKLAGASGAYVGFVYTKYMPVEPGRQYFISVQGRSVGGVAGGAVYNLEWADDEARTNFTETNFTQISSSTTTESTLTVTAPAKRFLRLRFYKNNNTATEAQFGGVIVRRMNSSELIVDGAITAAKIDALAVTAGKLAANSIDSNSLFVNGVITSQKLYSGAVEADRIQANNIAANAIVAGKIAAGAVSTTELAANAVTAEKIAIFDYQGLIPNGNFQTGDLRNWASVPAGYTVVSRATPPVLAPTENGLV
jgi:predicted phage tail protein